MDEILLKKVLKGPNDKGYALLLSVGFVLEEK